MLKYFWSLIFSSIILIGCVNQIGFSLQNQADNIKHIKLTGNYQEMGFQYGYQEKNGLLNYYKNQLLPAYEHLLNDPRQAFLIPIVMKSLDNNLPEEFKQFYYGMAQATGLSIEDIYKIAYFYDFDFTGGCSSFSAIDSSLRKNNYVVHTYDGSQDFYKILKHKTVILELHPNNGDESITLVTFYGSLSGFFGINHEKLVLQLNNGMLSVPLVSNLSILKENIMSKPQPTNLLTHILLKSKTHQMAKDILLSSSSHVSASTILLLSDNKLNQDIFYITPTQSIVQAKFNLIWPETLYLNFITNTFLNNPQSQPIENQQFIYSQDQDSPSLSFGRLQHLINFAESKRSTPSYQDSYNFLTIPYNKGGIIMLDSENHADVTFFKIIFSYSSSRSAPK